MIQNQNEKYLLKFMADGAFEKSRKNDLIKLVYQFGIKINFQNQNPVYQIIDEMDFDLRYKNIIGKKYD